jgi:hypothetical protein
MDEPCGLGQQGGFPDEIHLKQLPAGGGAVNHANKALGPVPVAVAPHPQAPAPAAAPAEAAERADTAAETARVGAPVAATTEAQNVAGADGAADEQARAQAALDAALAAESTAIAKCSLRELAGPLQTVSEKQLKQLEKDAKVCAQCSVKFGVTTRKHHCRQCHGVFCDGCSGSKFQVGGKPSRVCDTCFALLTANADAGFEISSTISLPRDSGAVDATVESYDGTQIIVCCAQGRFVLGDTLSAAQEAVVATQAAKDATLLRVSMEKELEALQRRAARARREAEELPAEMRRQGLTAEEQDMMMREGVTSLRALSMLTVDTFEAFGINITRSRKAAQHAAACEQIHGARAEQADAQRTAVAARAAQLQQMLASSDDCLISNAGRELLCLRLSSPAQLFALEPQAMKPLGLGLLDVQQLSDMLDKSVALQPCRTSLAKLKVTLGEVAAQVSTATLRLLAATACETWTHIVRRASLSSRRLTIEIARTQG